MDKNSARDVLRSWQGILPRVLNMLYVGTEGVINKFPKCHINLGGGAWTNVDELHVGLPEFFVEGFERNDKVKKVLGHDPNEDEAGVMIKALGFHEIFHIFYSDWKQMEAFENWWVDEFKNLWDGKSKIQRAALGKLGHAFENAVEDGRIENLGGWAYPGVIKPLQFKNLLFCSINEPSKSNYVNFQQGITMYLRLGLWPNWWVDMPEQVTKPAQKIKKDLLDFISTSSALSARRKMQKAVHKIQKELEILLKEDFDDALAEQALMQFISEIVQEFKNCSSPMSSSSPSSGSGSSSGICIHIQLPAEDGDSSEGDNSEDGDKSQDVDSGSGSGQLGDDKADEQDGDSSGSGSESKSDDKDGDKDGKGSGSSDKSDSKDGKDGDGQQDGKSDGDGDGSSDKKEAQSTAKRRKAPPRAERGGKEGQKTSPQKNADNNGQGTTDGTNSAPDDSDETVTDINQQLLAEAKNRLQQISSEAHDDTSKDFTKAKQAEKKELTQGEKDPSLTDEEIDSVKSVYAGKDSYCVAGYKEIKVTAKEPADAAVVSEGRRFRRDVEKILKAQQETRIRGTSRGRLCNSQLYRLGRKDFNVFEVRNIPDKTDTAVYIIWDNSGSMCGDKQRLSTIACSVIEEGLKGLVPLAITAFSTDGSCVKHWKVKGFREVSKTHNYAWSHGNAKMFSGGNKDGYSIRIATKEILKRPESQKLLIVLSDGLPSDYSSTQFAMDDVQDAVKQARKSGVNVISVMFGDDAFRESEVDNYLYMYQSGIIATSPERLTIELIKQIRKIVFNRG